MNLKDWIAQVENVENINVAITKIPDADVTLQVRTSDIEVNAETLLIQPVDDSEDDRVIAVMRIRRGEFRKIKTIDERTSEEIQAIKTHYENQMKLMATKTQRQSRSLNDAFRHIESLKSENELLRQSIKLMTLGKETA